MCTGMAQLSTIAARRPAAGPLSAGALYCWRRAVQAGADGAGELSEEGAEAAEAAVAAARAACEALQRQLLDGELRTYAALGGLLGQAERRHADAAEAGRQHFDTFFGTARPWPLAHSTDIVPCTPAAPCQQCELAVLANSKAYRYDMPECCFGSQDKVSN